MVLQTRPLLVLLVVNMLFTLSCIKSKERARRKAIMRKPVATASQKQPAKVAKRTLHKAHLPSAWYTQEPKALDTELDDYFAMAQSNFYAEVDPNAIRALVVPHAGHYYSGLCAASTYQSLFTTKNLYSKDLKNNHIKRVVILAPSHTKYFTGVGLPDYTDYQTPLGNIPVDLTALAALHKEKHFAVHADAHAAEHAIEVQLPFLQKCVANFTVVPLIVGQLASYEQAKAIGNSLKKLIDEHTLVVVSTDFTHHGKNYNFQPFNQHINGQIRYIDSMAIQAITSKSQEAFEKVLEITQATICGQNPLRILLYLLEEEYVAGLEPRLTCYYTSAHLQHARQGTSLILPNKLLATLPDSAMQNSVSYAGIVFTQQHINKLRKQNQLTDYEKQSLTVLCRDVITNQFQPKHQQVPEHLLWPVLTPGLEKSSGLFVTLNTASTGKLRGCIGRILSYEPLYKTAINMAKSAAFADRRFKPLEQKELADTAIEVSILTQPEKVGSFEEIAIGTHGIILNKFAKTGTLKASAVFLPQVARNNNWNLRTTLEQLSIKAGLGKDGWQEGAELQVFEGFEIHEKHV